MVVICAVLFAGCASHDAKTIVEKPKSTQTVYPDGASRITIPELEEMLKNNTALVIDVRNKESYEEEHIAGSKFIPQNELIARISELPRDKMIVTYCSCANEHTAAVAVNDLKAKGITNAAALLGGFNEWKKLQKPIQKGL
jgi:rhodanese-related sulfurtransferase